MVVDHAGRLHVGVDDGRADEAEASLLQVLANRLGERRRGGDLLQAPPRVLDRRAVDERPDVAGEAALLLLHLEEGLGVGDRGPHLEPVAHDAGIGEQRLDPLASSYRATLSGSKPSKARGSPRAC